MPEDSYPFATYSGLLTPDHYQRIGAAIWLFLWCVSSTTKEVEKDGVVWGIVKGNKPHKLSELAELFGVNEKTVRRWLNALEDYEYIRITRAPYGLVLTVKNSKKYKNRLDKNVQSQEKRERTNLSNHPANLSTLSDKNVQSNKDITEDITRDITKDVVVNIRAKKESKIETPLEPIDHIADYYMVRRGKPGMSPRASDYKHVQSIISSGVSVEEALAGIDQAFEEFNPNYDGDEITSFAYCKKVILSNFYSKNAREEAMKEPSTSNPKVNFKSRSREKKRNPNEAPLPKWMSGENKPDYASKKGEQSVTKQDNTSTEDREKWLEEFLNNL